MTVAMVAPVDPLTQLKLAREVAADIRELEDILKAYDVSPSQWDALQRSPRFQNLLQSAISEWQSVKNTAERVKVKSMAFVEEALPEFYARVHDAKETLSSKNEVLKTISRLAGFGERVEGQLAGERMVITINLGADNQLKFEKTQDMPTIDLSAGEYEDWEVASEGEIYVTSEVTDVNDELGMGLEDEDE